ncbi:MULTISPECIES: EamA family transporter [Streptomyces]|uniref:EamA family transporter n=1 Tax=Streptomyces koelreuteriae TaxID=2838015 RepID=A0ABX8FK73_9ACTN|nr:MULTISPECIES: EamA family transporter [Streptomyces]QWB21546.1 EamA family transporter [Streptomyces koelreuteriae]UUA04468.1 EamA family transporter [Streptomyces koelreuteriae]UUA12093.1 EamA family transporter [Streptomyces sp. CRCS-T-1]
MIALLLALGSSLAYGCADFLGGLGARKAHVLRTVMIAAPASLVVELLLWPVLGASFGVGALGWGAASGVASAAAFVLLYRTLAIGPMNVLSPVTALVSAALPVGVGLLQGEHLAVAGLVGLPLALVTVVLVSAGHGAGAACPSRTALLLAFGAGATIALQLIFLHRAPSDSGVAPLIVGRAVSSGVTLAAAGVLYRRLGPERPAYAMSACAGVLDSVANLLFLLAERVHRGQLVGLGTAAVAVSLLALT